MALQARKCMHCNGIAAHSGTLTVNLIFATETFTCVECRKDILIEGYMLCGLYAAIGWTTFVLVPEPLNVLCALFFGGLAARSIYMRRKNPKIENIEAELMRVASLNSQGAGPSAGPTIAGAGRDRTMRAAQPQASVAGFNGMPPFKILWSVFGVFIFAALYHLGSSADANTKAVEKVAMTKDFGLDADQGEMYDQCVSTMSGKKLKNGGSKAEFCGCVVKTVTADQSAASYSGIAANLSAIVLDEATGKDMGAENLAARLNVGMAIRLCADHATRDRIRYPVGNDDKRRSWSSLAERLQWCAAKNERAQDMICQLSATQAR